MSKSLTRRFVMVPLLLVFLLPLISRPILAGSVSLTIHVDADTAGQIARAAEGSVTFQEEKTPLLLTDVLPSLRDSLLQTYQSSEAERIAEVCARDMLLIDYDDDFIRETGGNSLTVLSRRNMTNAFLSM